MKSASYLLRCDKCMAHEGYTWSAQPRALYASPEVYKWVSKRVHKSALIKGLASDCIGCLNVYEEVTRVWANTLCKLGIKI